MQIAYDEISGAHQQYLNLLENERKVVETINGLETGLKRKRENVEMLRAQLKETRLAIDLINANLKCIFLNADRMCVCSCGDKYVLKVRGNDVNVRRISTGERNVLALCYFLADMGRGLRPTEATAQEYLVVLDDPTSSFDRDMRIGVMSLLGRKIMDILNGNIRSRVLLMSHEIHVLYGLRRIVEKYNKSQGKNDSKKLKYGTFQLKNVGLVIDDVDKHNEYRHMLETVYKFAIGNGDVDGMVIGNMMRRTLEAFSTFSYLTAMDDLFVGNRADRLLKEFAKYFQTVYSRFVINDESHFKSRMSSLEDDGGLYDRISPEEKRRLSRDVLCLLSLYNREHVSVYLGQSCQGAMQKIDSWLSSLKETFI